MIPIRDDNPTERLPIITVGLIIINIMVFIYQLSLGKGAVDFIYNYGMVPYFVHNPQAAAGHIYFPPELTLITSMFLHGGFLHIIGNMLYFWIFGNNIEDELGHIPFLMFYLICGLAAGFAQLAANPNSQLPTIGASGAIAGVLGAYLIRFPHTRVLTLLWLGFFVRLVYIPAVFVLGFWFILQLLFALPSIGAGQGGGIAYFAHIGGFVIGIILFPIFKLFFGKK